MAAVQPQSPKLVITGRSSSHFTRVTRIYAAELDVAYSFEVVRDLMSGDADAYAGNPALKLPTLRTSEGAWFGALNICRELARRSMLQRRLLWPEDLEAAVTANAQELIVQAMTTEVALIMSQVSNGGESVPYREKMKRSLAGVMSWLEANATRAVGALPPERDLSYLEVTLYCLVTHLEFRGVLSTAAYSELNELCRRFSARASAQATPYRFDR